MGKETDTPKYEDLPPIIREVLFAGHAHLDDDIVYHEAAVVKAIAMLLDGTYKSLKPTIEGI